MITVICLPEFDACRYASHEDEKRHASLSARLSKLISALEAEERSHERDVRALNGEPLNREEDGGREGCDEGGDDGEGGGEGGGGEGGGAIAENVPTQSA